MCSVDVMDEAKSPCLGAKFKRLYKAVSPGAPGAVSWKEVYRRRCHERLLDSRQSLLEKFRFPNPSDEVSNGSSRTSAIQTLVMNEWRAFTQDLEKTRKSDGTSAELEDEDIDVECDDIDHVDSVISVFEEITAELLKEEEQIIAEYEARNRLDDDALCASVRSMTTAEVICPICQKSPLFINKGVVFCSCGVRVNTEQDAITLDMIDTNLHNGVKQHSSTCQHTPSFSVVNHPGITSILMTCEACDYMYIVV